MSTIRAGEGLDAGGPTASGGPSQVSTRRFVGPPYIGMIDDRRESAMNLQRFDLNLLVALDALLTDKNVTLRVGYSGQFTASGTTHGATLKFTRSF